MARPRLPPTKSPHQKAATVGLFGGSVAASHPSPHQKAATKPLPSLAQQTTQSINLTSNPTSNCPFAIFYKVASNTISIQ